MAINIFFNDPDFLPQAVQIYSSRYRQYIAMSNTFKKTVNHYFDFAKKHRLPWIDPAPLVNEVDHKAFNYSLEEPILRRFGGYFDITEEYNFSTIQPCIRGADVAAIKRHKTKDHLSLFHIMPTNFHLSPDPEKLPGMQRQGIKNTLAFLDTLGIDLSRLRITYFPGGFLDEISQGLVPVHKYFPEDKVTVDSFLQYGLSALQLKSVAHLDTFVATFAKNQDFYAGYRFEIFHPLPDGHMLEIGTGEAIAYRQIRQKDITIDVVEAPCSFVPIALGLERVQAILEQKNSVLEIEPISRLAKEFSCLFSDKKVDKLTLLQLADVFRAVHLLLSQNKLFSKQQRKNFRETISYFCSFFNKHIQNERCFYSLIETNASINFWLQLKGNTNKAIALALIDNINKRKMTDNDKHVRREEKMNINKLQTIIDASLNLNWPARIDENRNIDDKTIKKIYEQDYNNITKGKFLHNELMICWDDWDLAVNGWYNKAPYRFKNDFFKSCAKEFSKVYQSLKENIIKSGVKNTLGVSYLIYRYMYEKKIISFYVTDKFNFKLTPSSIEFGIPPTNQINLNEEIPLINKVIENKSSYIFITREDFFNEIESYCKDSTSNNSYYSTIQDHLNLSSFYKFIPKEKVENFISKLHKSIFRDNNEMPTTKAAEDFQNFSLLLYNMWVFFSLFSKFVTKIHYITAKGFFTPSKTNDKNHNTLFEECSGGIYIWCDEKTEVDLEALQAYQTYRGLRTSVVDFAKREEREVRKLALKNAMSVIMSRNMSHNIGSHVMPRTEPPMVFDRLKQFYSDEPYAPTDIFIYGMAQNILTRLHRYIRYKSDFLAEITTEPGASTRKARFFMDVMANFLGNTLLMDNLAAMEGFRYGEKWSAGCDGNPDNPDFATTSPCPATTLKITSTMDGPCKRQRQPQPFEPVFTTGRHNDRQYTYKNTYVPLGWRDIRAYGEDLTLTHLQENNPLKDSPGDPIIALPGPLGEFAMYGFLENYIRNAAKHNQEIIKGTPESSLEIELKIKEEEEEKGEDKKKYSNDYYLLEISNNVWDEEEKIIQLEKELTDLLESSLINEKDNTPRKEGWGIAEMMICANLLAGKNTLYSYHQESEDGKSAHALTIRKVEHQEDCNKSRLVYTLRLMKPRQAILFGNLFLTDHPLPEIWEKKGILHFPTLAQYAREIDTGDTVASSFDFAVLDGEAAKKLTEYEHLLPFRLIVVTEKNSAQEILELLSKGKGVCITKNQFNPGNDADEFISQLWEYWLSKRWPAGASTLALYLGQKDNEFPTTLWKKKCEKFSDNYPVLLNEADASSERGGKIVMFDRHSQLLPGTEEQGNIASYNVFDKSSADFAQIFHPPGADPWTFPYELLEAGLLKVLVLDERIAENAMKPFDDEKIAEFLTGQRNRQPLFWHLARRANVCIATHIKIDEKRELMVHEQSYKSQKKQPSASKTELKPCLPKLTFDISENENIKFSVDDCDGGKNNSDLNNLDMLIIHQGILDRLDDAGKGKPEEPLKQWKKTIPWVIVESGRGVPPEIQTTSDKFLPFSALDHCLNGIRVAKLSLAQRTMTLVRKKNRQ